MSHVYIPTVPKSTSVVCARCGQLTTAIQFASGMASPCRAELPPPPPPPTVTPYHRKAPPPERLKARFTLADT